MKEVYGWPLRSEKDESRIVRPSTAYSGNGFSETVHAVNILTDFGTEVLAARDGIVFGIKRVEDVCISPEGFENDSEIIRLVRLAARHTNRIVLQHRGGTHTEYLHLAQNSIRLFKGYHVKKGDLIGRTGPSGVMSEPRLYFNAFKFSDGSLAGVPFEFE